MVGRVVANKMEKTVTVIVTRTVKHPLYKKSYIKSKKYLVDDQLGVKPGDIVEMKEIKPMSKNKHFTVTKIVGRDIEEIVEQELKEEAKEAIEVIMPEEEIKAEDKAEEEK